MCLGELGRVLVVTAGSADVQVGDRVRTVSLLTLDDPVAPGDWVQIHSGFALARLTDDEAREAEQIRSLTDAEEQP
ncbi:MAG TPA: HypC/HybG/HupF family hydrogenase formation chaperone [Nocardioides sp.]|uniref:HypC/HybG/HupF family hydrogenase formation chaperone n=1 Tax=Nocardioides sp. TaxID=35761 RepID=UPI002E2F471B|nr:HypC/HybG/HupF family hydrogenase formation chaperone [Nocardioides sp.]HEX5087234.1 HypC/HybG/HupF family hydrogenase formation chaperone [Nocardioides sp.]